MKFILTLFLLIFMTFPFQNNFLEIKDSINILLSSRMSIPIKRNTCKEISIPNNFKKLNLTLISSGISEILLTDKRISQCQNQNQKYQSFTMSNCCDENSTFCMNNINPSYNYFHLYYCLEESYIYICSKNVTNSHLSITVNVIKGEGCQIAEYFEETECATTGLINCKNQNTCNNKCQYIECLNDKQNFLFDMCLPVNFTETDILERCSEHVDFLPNGKYKVQVCQNKNESIDRGNIGHHLLVKVILILFGVFLLGLYMSSIYYRFKIKLDINRAPFTPPWWCPNFLFPRVNKSILVF